MTEHGGRSPTSSAGGRSPTSSAGGRSPTSSSVALLDAVVRDALDPSYAEAAERRRRAGDDRSGALAGGAVGLVLLVAVSVVIGLAVASQHKTLPRVGAARGALAGDAGDRTRQIRALEASAASLRTTIAALGRQNSAAASAVRLLAQQSAVLANAAAEQSLQGPGVSVTVSDVTSATSPDGGMRPHGQLAERTGRVTDADLQSIVNALWSQGAEAITVGGIRLGPQSAIRTAGETILVNFRAVRSPYLISAIVGPDVRSHLLQLAAFTALTSGAAGTHPDVSIRSTPLLVLPAAPAGKTGSAQPLATGAHS